MAILALFFPHFFKSEVNRSVRFQLSEENINFCHTFNLRKLLGVARGFLNFFFKHFFSLLRHSKLIIKKQVENQECLLKTRWFSWRHLSKPMTYLMTQHCQTRQTSDCSDSFIYDIVVYTTIGIFGGNYRKKNPKPPGALSTETLHSGKP